MQADQRAGPRAGRSHRRAQRTREQHAGDAGELRCRQRQAGGIAEVERRRRQRQRAEREIGAVDTHSQVGELGRAGQAAARLPLQLRREAVGRDRVRGAESRERTHRQPHRLAAEQANVGTAVGGDVESEHVGSPRELPRRARHLRAQPDPQARDRRRRRVVPRRDAHGEDRRRRQRHEPRRVGRAAAADRAGQAEQAPQLVEHEAPVVRRILQDRAMQLAEGSRRLRREVLQARRVEAMRPAGRRALRIRQAHEREQWRPGAAEQRRQRGLEPGRGDVGDRSRHA
jgi:hypothetical protein